MVIRTEIYKREDDTYVAKYDRDMKRVTVTHVGVGTKTYTLGRFLGLVKRYGLRRVNI